MGVWIEIHPTDCTYDNQSVTPLVGVWIEIECMQKEAGGMVRHSPCGSVD